MRLLWFACHGNVYVRHAEISQELVDPHTVRSSRGPLLLLLIDFFFAE
jgi:hypothetical protein